jgi:hypothetical protein
MPLDVVELFVKLVLATLDFLLVIRHVRPELPHLRHCLVEPVVEIGLQACHHGSLIRNSLGDNFVKLGKKFTMLKLK